jgi:hypothetical protein
MVQVMFFRGRDKERSAKIAITGWRARPDLWPVHVGEALESPLGDPLGSTVRRGTEPSARP